MRRKKGSKKYYKKKRKLGFEMKKRGERVKDNKTIKVLDWYDGREMGLLELRKLHIQRTLQLVYDFYLSINFFFFLSCEKKRRGMGKKITKSFECILQFS